MGQNRVDGDLRVGYDWENIDRSYVDPEQAFENKRRTGAYFCITAVFLYYPTRII